jgi:hypothetical protein
MPVFNLQARVKEIVMKQFSSMNTRRLVLFVIVLAILCGAIFLGLRNIIREVFVIPLSYLFFLAKIFIDSTPQVFFWGALIILSIWITSRSLSSRQKKADLAFQGSPVADHYGEATGRLHYWVVKMNILRHYRGSYFMGGFHQSFGRLVVELLAHQEHLTTAQVEDRIRGGSLDLPEDIRDYLITSLSRPEYSPGRFEQLWGRIREAIRRWLHWPGPKEKEGTPFDRAFNSIDRVIQFMEEELEISHEHSSQSSR